MALKRSDRVIKARRIPTEKDSDKKAWGLFDRARPLTDDESLTDAETLQKFWEADGIRLQQAVQDRLAEGRGVLGLVDPDLPKTE